MREADWGRLQDSLADTCWDHIADQCTSAAAKRITDTILRSANSCIPLTTLRSRKSSQPWLNDRSAALVDAKRAAEGTPLHASQYRVRHGDLNQRQTRGAISFECPVLVFVQPGGISTISVLPAQSSQAANLLVGAWAILLSPLKVLRSRVHRRNVLLFVSSTKILSERRSMRELTRA